MSDPRYGYRDEYDDETKVMRRRDRASRRDERVRTGQSRTTTVRVTTTVITIVTSLFAVILALHIVLSLLQANPGNPLVTTTADLSQVLVIFFRDLFTTDYEWLNSLLNYGLAALFWLGIGRGIVMLVRSFR